MALKIFLNVIFHSFLPALFAVAPALSYVYLLLLLELPVWLQAWLLPLWQCYSELHLLQKTCPSLEFSSVLIQEFPFLFSGSAGQPAAAPERLNKEGGLLQAPLPPPFHGCEGLVGPGIASGSFLPSLPTPRVQGTEAEAASEQARVSGRHGPSRGRGKAAATSVHPFTPRLPPLPREEPQEPELSAKTSRTAPGRPPVPRPTLLPPPLQCRAVTATSRTRVGNSG